MEIILRADVEHLGRRGEVVTVADGYARNYLLPRKLALRVTASNARQVEREQAAAAARAAEERTAAEGDAARLGAVECVIARRVGETGTLYGSVTSADIAEYLERRELQVDKRRIQLAEPIKELGTFTVAVRLHRDVRTEITVHVVRDEEAPPDPADVADAASPAPATPPAE